MIKRFHTFIACALFSCAALVATESQAANCGMGQYDFTLDWDGSYATWTSGELAKSISVPDAMVSKSVDVDVKFGGATNRVYQPQFPETSNLFYGKGQKKQKSLAWAHDLLSNSERVTITFTFSTAVENLSFFVLDVDSLNSSGGYGGFRDAIEIRASNAVNGSSPLPILSTPYHSSGYSYNSAIYLGSPLASNQALGYMGQADNGNDYGRLNVNFSQPVTEVIVEYSNKLFSPSSTPAPQGISIGDLSFCATPMPTADVKAIKTQKLHSETSVDCDLLPGTPDPDAAFAGPGACIEYQIEATNVGDAIASDLTIQDTLNDNMIFQAASHSGFIDGGPGFGLSTPEKGQDCSGGACKVSIDAADLPASSTGKILIRALIK